MTATSEWFQYKKHNSLIGRIGYGKKKPPAWFVENCMELGKKVTEKEILTAIQEYKADGVQLPPNLNLWKYNNERSTPVPGETLAQKENESCQK